MSPDNWRCGGPLRLRQALPQSLILGGNRAVKKAIAGIALLFSTSALAGTYVAPMVHVAPVVHVAPTVHVTPVVHGNSAIGVHSATKTGPSIGTPHNHPKPPLVIVNTVPADKKKCSDQKPASKDCAGVSSIKP